MNWNGEAPVGNLTWFQRKRIEKKLEELLIRAVPLSFRLQTEENFLFTLVKLE